MRRQSSRRPGVLVALVGALTIIGTNGASAQGEMVGLRMASRAELEATLDSLQRVATVSTVSDEGRMTLQHQISNLARRLEQGDVWPGDQVVLTVSGEDRWSGTFTVSPDRTIELPAIDPVDVSGVLYSELEEKIARQIGRYVREPRIRVDVLKRIGVLGEVGSPGFHNVPGSMLVSELIMRAGGPTARADLNKVVFRRFGHPIESGRPRVVWESLTLDQLGLISGDEVFVPQKSSFVLVRVLGFVLGTALTITLIATRI